MIGNEDGQQHRDQGHGTGEDVDRIIPRVGGQRGATGCPACAHLHPGHNGFGDDRQPQRPNGEQGGRLYAGLQGISAYGSARSRQQYPHGQSDQCFEPTMAVGMVLIGRFGGDSQSQVDQARGDHVGGRFQAVRDRRHGVRGQADAGLQRREHGARRDTGQGYASGRSLD